MKKLGFGTMRLPYFGNNDKDIDLEQYKKMIDIFMERGFTYFDTAYMYCSGESERALKKALVERYPRESYTVTTKLTFLTKDLEDADRIFNDQLEKTGLTYFDYYWLHNVNKNSLERIFDKCDCWSWLINKKEEGLVKHIGFSFHDNAELLDELLTKHPEIEFVQLQLNYLDWESDNVQSHKCYDVCVKHNKKVIVMEPVKGGDLANVDDKVTELFKAYDNQASVASWAVRFAASLDNVYMVLSGMSNIKQVEDNTSYMADFKPLTQEEIDMCFKAAEIINESKPIKCTGCSYCTEGCPMSIKIPSWFNFYNKLVNYKEKEIRKNFKNRFLSMNKDLGTLSECLQCGQCESVCPQHLPIIENLKKVDEEINKVFE